MRIGYNPRNGDYIASFNPGRWRMHICSVVELLGYEPGNGLNGANAGQTALQVSVVPSPTYSDEYVKIHLQLTGAAGVGQSGCPELYLLTRRAGSSAGQSYRYADFESVDSDDYRAVGDDKEGYFLNYRHNTLPSRRGDAGHPRAGQKRRCDGAGGVSAAVLSVEANELPEIAYIAGRVRSATNSEPTLTSAATSFAPLDPATLPPNWGARVKGIGAGLSVDKTVFHLGEKIPVHVQWEDFEASSPIGFDECNYFQPVVEVQDAGGQVLGTIAYHIEDCFGHGAGPFQWKAGQLYRQYVEVATGRDEYRQWGDGDFAIRQPGVYYLTTVWSPPVWTKVDGLYDVGRNGAELGAVYGTARSAPVQIKILPAR